MVNKERMSVLEREVNVRKVRKIYEKLSDDLGNSIWHNPRKQNIRNEAEKSNKSVGVKISLARLRGHKQIGLFKGDYYLNDCASRMLKRVYKLRCTVNSGAICHVATPLFCCLVKRGMNKASCVAIWGYARDFLVSEDDLNSPIWQYKPCDTISHVHLCVAQYFIIFHVLFFMYFLLFHELFQARNICDTFSPNNTFNLA